MHAREAEMHLASRFVDFVADDERKKEAGEGSGRSTMSIYTPFKYTRQALHIIFKSHFFLILELIDCENNRDKYKVDIIFCLIDFV